MKAGTCRSTTLLGADGNSMALSVSFGRTAALVTRIVRAAMRRLMRCILSQILACATWCTMVMTGGIWKSD